MRIVRGKYYIFSSIFDIFEEILHFWASYMRPEAAGEPCKIFWAHKILWLTFCELKLHAKILPPPSRPIFVKKTQFLLIFGQWRNFWEVVSRRKPSGGSTKKFAQSYNTFKHPTILLGWSDEVKGSSQKKFTPLKMVIFRGGGWLI